MVALGAYFGREFLITRNVTRALLQEIDNAHAQCKDHLSKSDYEKAKKDILADETYIPYIGWQPVPHELYKKAIEELFLLTGDLIAVVQKAYDSEVTIEIMVTKLEGPVFAGMKQSRRASFLDHVHNAIIEDEQNLEEARDALTRHQILSRFFFG